MNRNESYVRKLIESDQRVDSRALQEFRDVKINTGILKNAEGSAEVFIGKTRVMVGIKLSVVEPFSDTPDEGVIMVGAEFDPVASPKFESGPPGADSVELARVVDRGIRESHCIDLGKLCIKAKEKVWSVSIDIEVLDHDGNLIDAAALASIAALHNAKLPAYDEKEDKIDYEKRGKGLPMKDTPIEITVNKIGNKLILDLTDEEEEAMDARLTVATTETGDICALQKGGDGYFTKDEIKQAVEIVLGKSDELRKLLKV